MLDFKSKLKEKYKDRKVRHFSRGISKLSNSFHTQLRLGCSFLAAHGYAIVLNDSDLCLCWRPETTKHYFWDCFLFQEERSKLFCKFSQILPGFTNFSKSKQLDTILFGINLGNKDPDPRNILIVFAVYC